MNVLRLIHGIFFIRLRVVFIGWIAYFLFRCFDWISISSELSLPIVSELSVTLCDVSLSDSFFLKINSMDFVVQVNSNVFHRFYFCFLHSIFSGSIQFFQFSRSLIQFLLVFLNFFQVESKIYYIIILKKIVFFFFITRLNETSKIAANFSSFLFK